MRAVDPGGWSWHCASTAGPEETGFTATIVIFETIVIFDMHRGQNLNHRKTAFRGWHGGCVLADAALR